MRVTRVFNNVEDPASAILDDGQPAPEGPASDADDARRLRWAGIAGLVASLFWIVGDVLLLGTRAQPADFPLLLERYAPRIEFPGLPQMLPASEPRLAAGALIAALTSSLYLVGAWHLFQVARTAGTRWSRTVFGIFIFGFANAPLGHAGFYFVGMIYKTMLDLPESAHARMLVVGNQFFRVLLIPYVAAVGGIVLGLLLLAILTGLGRTRWPRWMALVVNPVSLAFIGEAVQWPVPQPVRTWLGGAGISIGTFVLFGSSLWLTNRSRAGEPRKAT